MTKNEKKWLLKFKLLEEYKEKYDKFPKHEEKYKGIALGTWCGTQRQLYKKGMLEEDKIDLLNHINFIWDPNEYVWMENFELLKEFVEEFERFPKTHETYKGVNISLWYMSQSQGYRGSNKRKLSPERVQLLKSIGYKLSKKNRCQDKWMDYFRLLKKFKKKYKRFPYQKEDFEGVKLGRWCDTQRQIHKRGGKDKELIQKRINLLNSIDFVWKIKPRHND